MSVVAIVGKPNTGKSTLFNRIIKERLSIMDDTYGVTRDRLYAKGSWLGEEFTLIDTGGIEKKGSPIQEQIQIQTKIAIEQADIVVFVGDAKRGLDQDDLYISSQLLKEKKKSILAINKVDSQEMLSDAYDFYKLGLGNPIAISSIHGIGIGELLDKIIEKLPKENERAEESDEISFSFIGRENVGKSSLVNCILNEKRVIVSKTAGTTRDSIYENFTRDEKKYKIIDTAGIKKRGKIFENVEKYAYVRALNAIDKSDVVCIVLDAYEGIREQDKKIAGYAFKANKAIVLVVNKWDKKEKDTNTMNEFRKIVRKEFPFLSFVPISFVSALKGQKIDNLFSLINESFQMYNKRIKTSVLNQVLLNATMLNQPKEHNSGRVNILYANQVGVKPPTFVFFVNHKKYLHFSYERYLKNVIRENFGFEGTPIVFKYKNKFD